MWGGNGGACQYGSDGKDCVDCNSVGVILVLPLLNQGMNGINQAVLRDGVEEAHKIIVGGM